MKSLRVSFIRYVACVELLHERGERAWPWNVFFVWDYVATGPDDTQPPRYMP